MFEDAACCWSRTGLMEERKFENSYAKNTITYFSPLGSSETEDGKCLQKRDY